MRGPATAVRPRPTTGSHRPPPPPRRTFSSGQRALLWAAGVLGALAIISAILIVLADRDRRENNPVEQTVTDPVIGNPRRQPGQPHWVAAAQLTLHDPAPPAQDETSQ
jgi:serine/threonine-protein kinase